MMVEKIDKENKDEKDIAKKDKIELSIKIMVLTILMN